MVCNLPAPQWDNPTRAGLQSAEEQRGLHAIELTWGSATAVDPAEVVQFNIYFSEIRDDVFDNPMAFSEGNSALIPTSLAADGYYFAVRPSQMGIASIDADLSSMAINDTAFSYPNPIRLETPYTDGYIIDVNSVEGYPPRDGYIRIGQEVIYYANAIDGYDGYDGYSSFLVKNRDPFGCNSIVAHPALQAIILFKGFEEANSVFFKNAAVCALPEPVWANNIFPGIKLVEDLAVGGAVRVSWHPATTPNGLSQTYYNIYVSTIRDNLFDRPIGITTALTVVISGLQPGDAQYFGVRAAYYPEDIDITSLDQIGVDFYAYPTNTEVEEFDGYYFNTDTGPMVVSSTDGFPDNGVIKVGSELITYGSLTNSTFIVSQRDTFDREALATHANGTAVSLFKGIEDLNQVYYRAMPTWDGYATSPRLIPDGYELPNSMQDAEGFRVWKEDTLNEDHSVSEAEMIDINPQPFCGYRAQNFIGLFTRNQCGTYSGGRSDGFGGGIAIQEVNLQREEFLLSLTGEPISLLRLKTVGRQCPSFNLRTEHTHERCHLCFGTKILGGYDHYIHPRRYRSDRANPHGLFNARFSPYKNDLQLIGGRGLSQVDELSIWVPAVPFIKKRDIIIRYIFDEDQQLLSEEFRYEVIFVNRGQIILGFDGKQEISMRKLDKTHSIYQFAVDIP